MRNCGRTFGKPICDHQAIQLKLADMATRTEAARLLVEQARAYDDAGQRCDIWKPVWPSCSLQRAAVENAMEALRIHGACGSLKS